jgi:peroxiredoxin
MKRRSIRSRFGTLVFLGLVLFGASRCSRDLVVIKTGESAPAFTLRDLAGKTIALPDLKGKYVMIRFWADWCKACRTEMPMIDEKYRKFKEQGFEVLALNVRQNQALAAKFAKEVGISYPVLLDSDGSVAKMYGVVGLPTTFLLDRDGIVREEVVGDMNRKSLSALIDSLFGPEGRKDNPQ